MDTPYWVDIAEPDWDRHISESSLPGSGDWDTLQQTLGRLHGARMDPDHPLWEMHLIQTGGSPQLFKLPPPYQSELGRTF